MGRKTFRGILEHNFVKVAPSPRQIYIVCSHKNSEEPRTNEIGLLTLSHCNQVLKPGQRCGLGEPLCVAEERRAGRIRAGVV